MDDDLAGVHNDNQLDQEEEEKGSGGGGAMTE